RGVLAPEPRGAARRPAGPGRRAPASAARGRPRAALGAARPPALRVVAPRPAACGRRAAGPAGDRDGGARRRRARLAALPDLVPGNVCLLSPVYWPEVRRGTERFARGLADELIARGHRVRLICGHAGRRSATIEDGLDVIRVPRLPERRLERRGYERHLT